MTPILAARQLAKSYGPTTALAGVDLQIGAGESVAVMGASGSGKTTLLHVLAGIIAPDAGAVDFADGGTTADITKLSDRERSRLRRERFGFVFQQGLLLPELTALENVSLALLLNGTDRASADQLAGRWLGSLGLAGMEDRRIGQLSGGQAQRVAIARAQVTGAPVVFADEPTGALDSQTSNEVMTALLHATTGQGRTLVVVTHDPGVAARCGRTVHMRDGRIVAQHVAPDAGDAAAQAQAAEAARVAAALAFAGPGLPVPGLPVQGAPASGHVPGAPAQPWPAPVPSAPAQPWAAPVPGAPAEPWAASASAVPGPVAPTRAATNPGAAR